MFKVASSLRGGGPRANSFRSRRVTRAIPTPTEPVSGIGQKAAPSLPCSRIDRRECTTSVLASAVVAAGARVEHAETEVEWIEPAKRRVLPKGGRATFCIWRKSCFVQRSEQQRQGLCTSGRAWAPGSLGGKVIEQERGEAADPTMYALLLLVWWW